MIKMSFKNIKTANRGGVKAICIGLVCFLLISCKSMKNIPESSSMASEPNTPKLIFLNYIIRKKLDKSVEAKLVSKKVVEGTLKAGIQLESSLEAGDLVFAQLDAQLDKVDNFQLSNPLIKNIEYVTAEGELGKKQIELDSTELSVRLQLNRLTEFISVEIVSDSNIQLLKTAL